MRRTAAAAVVVAAAVVAALLVFQSSSPQLSAHLRRTFTACVSSDCGAYAITLEWSNLNFPNTTGYYMFANGTQVGTSAQSPYTFYGMDCGITVQLGVEAHDGSGDVSQLYSTPYTTPSCPSPFPLQVSGNGRYLENAQGQPWLLVGDSPQSVAGNLSTTNAASYLADRESHGFNAVWINLLCDSYTACASNGQTYDSVAPFTSGSSPSNYSFGAQSTSPYCNNCNSTYFSRVHTMVADAAADHIAVFLDPIETGGCTAGGWISMLTGQGSGSNNSSNPDYQYGEYLGTEFGDLTNIVWMSGNDFQCLSTAADNNDALAVAAGIHATDPSALQSLEADYCSGGGGNAGCEGSTSLTSTTGASTGWSSTVQLNGVYTYAPTFSEDRAAYAQSSTQPMFLAEANYEGQQVGTADGCGPGAASDSTSRNCRLQEWWTMTSGATGEMYGGPCYGITQSTTLSSCDTTGATELGYVTSLMTSIDWWNLAPDTGHTVVTSGYQSGSDCSTTSGSFKSNTCVTTASDYSGTAGSATESVSYLPDPSSLASITVNMADFAASVTAKWYDPTNGSYSTVTGSPFTNSGSHTFTPTGNNHAGDKDWVLLLQG